MNTEFSIPNYTSLLDICRWETFDCEEKIPPFIGTGTSIALLRRDHDISGEGDDCNSVAIYLTWLANKIEILVKEVFNKKIINSNEFINLRNRIANLCWTLEDLVIVSKEMEAGQPFKELEIHFWKQRMKLAISHMNQEPCPFHPSIQKLLNDNPSIHSALFIKLYPFSQDKLNVMALGIGIITGKISNIAVPPPILLMLLEHYSALGDEKAQERLYDFLKQPIGKSNFVDLKKASALLKSALKQEKMWAIKLKIKEMEDHNANPSERVPLYIMAAHKGDMDSHTKMAQICGDKVNIYIPENETDILKDYSIDKYMTKGFGTPCEDLEKIWLKYGVPLRMIGVKLHQNGSFENAAKYFEPAALLGDVLSMSMLGSIKMLQGRKLEALHWNRLAAENGNREGMQLLGSIEEMDFEGHVPNLLEALKWSTLAANQGSVRGCSLAGQIELKEFEGHTVNPQKAMAFLTCAAENDDRAAMFFFMTKAVELGDNEDMVALGCLEKEDFSGHPANLLKALYWFTEASNAGNITGMVAAGDLEAEAFKGHVPNFKKSLKWYTLAAAKGSSQAMYSAGNNELLTYDSHAPNKMKALKWFKKAAALGESNAMYHAAILEEQSFKGHISDPKKALVLMIQAALAENTYAMCWIGHVFLMLKDEKYIGQALLWLKRAINLGSSEAAAILHTALNAPMKEDKEILEVMNHSDHTQKGQLLDAPINLPVKELKIKEADEQNILELLIDSEESEESEEALELELLGYPDFSQNKPAEMNILEAKIKCEKIYEINERLETFQVTLKDLSKKNRALWESLRHESSPTVTISELIQFADDNALVGNFSYGPTKKGIMFCLSNKLNGIEKFETVSTHRKHHKSYKGVDKNFLAEFHQMVCTVLGFE